MSTLTSLAAILAAYLVGSLSFAVIISRAMGLADPRSYGSKNPGATNVRRVLGSGAGNLVFVLDALKGALAAGWPVWLMRYPLEVETRLAALEAEVATLKAELARLRKALGETS